VSNKIIKDEERQEQAVNKPVKKPSQARLKQGTGATTTFEWSAKAVLLTIGAICVLLACIYVGYDQLREHYVITVSADGDKGQYSMSDLGYYIYEEEAQGQTMAAMYAQFYGADYDYWNAESSTEGETNAEVASDNVIDAASKDFVLYQKAVSEGYSATDDDKSAAQSETDEIVKNIKGKHKLKTGLSKKEIYEAVLKKTIAARYRTDKIASLNVDYDKATKDITKKDYKQYDFEYFYLSTEGETDAEGKTKELTKDELAKKKSTIDAFYETVKSTEDFSTVFGNDDKGNPKTSNDDGITYNADGQMLAKDGFKNLDKTIAKMKVGEVSKVLEGEDGYYIIKLKDNTSTSSYDEAISDAKTKADDEAFDEEYQNNILPNYTVDTDYDVWEQVKLGTYSIN
jgi:foldase protein PrsA